MSVHGGQHGQAIGGPVEIPVRHYDARDASMLSLLSRSPTLMRLGLDEQQPAVTILSRQSQGFADDTSYDISAPLLGADDGSLQPPPPPTPPPVDASTESKLQFAYNLSWVVNILLFVAKGYAYYLSSSKAVLASLLDSLVDLISQGIIFVAEYQSKKADPRFPVGKARLETIGVLACACIMSVAAYEVIEESGWALYRGIREGELPDLETGLILYVVLGAATALKMVCYLICVGLQHKSDSMLALAEDHLNDVMSNVAAAATAVVASRVAGAWWVDPAGGIAISLLIAFRWFQIAQAQVEKIVGRGAPMELVEQLKSVANEHHPHVEVDCLRAYTWGSRYFVEAEVVMPEVFSLKEVHDLSLALQIRLEALSLVERAFVHADYQKRYEPEHRTERLLAGLPVVAEEDLDLGSPV